MIKKLFISLLSFVGLGLSFANALNCNLYPTNYFCGGSLSFGSYDNTNLYYGGSVTDNRFNFSSINGSVFTFNIPLNGSSFNVLTYYWSANGFSYSSRYASGDTERAGSIDGFYVCSTYPGNGYNQLRYRDNCTYNDGFSNLGSYTSNATNYWFGCSRGYPNISSNHDVNCIVCVCSGACGPNKQAICIDTSKTSNNSNSYVPVDQITNIAGPNPVFNPGYYDGSIEGGSQEVNFDDNLTGDTVSYSCNKQLALDWYNCNGYKVRTCYAGYSNNNDIFDGPGSVSDFALTGLNIEDVWFETAWYRRYGTTGESMPYDKWFAYWRKTYEVYKKNPDINNPFNGVPVSLFTLMGNIDSYSLPYSNESILEYCDLAMFTADYSKPYNGVAKNVVCNLTPVEVLDCRINGNPNNPGSSGYHENVTVGVVGSSWDGITNRSGYHFDGPSNLSNISDGENFLNNYFNKLKSSFRYGVGHGIGIIPSYIIIALCGLIFFRFLRKY